MKLLGFCVRFFWFVRHNLTTWQDYLLMIARNSLAFDRHFFALGMATLRMIEKAFGVDCRHTAGARGCDCLAID